MPLINCNISLFLTCSSTCVITNSTAEGRFTITDTKLFVPVITLSTQDNTILLQQLKSGFSRTINWNQYQSDPKTYAQNRYLNHLINPSFQGVNRLFVLSFENENDRTSHSNYYLPKLSINSELKTYENIRKIATGKGDDYTTGCLLDYSYFKENYKMIATYLSKQEALDADLRTIQRINFTADLDKAGNTSVRLFTRNCTSFANAILLSATSLNAILLNAVSSSDLISISKK